MTIFSKVSCLLVGVAAVDVVDEMAPVVERSAATGAPPAQNELSAPPFMFEDVNLSPSEVFTTRDFYGTWRGHKREYLEVVRQVLQSHHDRRIARECNDHRIATGEDVPITAGMKVRLILPDDRANHGKAAVIDKSVKTDDGKWIVKGSDLTWSHATDDSAEPNPPGRPEGANIGNDTVFYVDRHQFQPAQQMAFLIGDSSMDNKQWLNNESIHIDPTKIPELKKNLENILGI